MVSQNQRSSTNHPFLIVQSTHGFHSVMSNTTFHTGDIITPFSAKTSFNHPTRFSLQVGADKHILLQPDMLQYVNHSCNPNVFFNTDAMHLECIRDIQPGDEITFFYPSTEWDMAEGFVCHCGASHCLGGINGAKSLNKTLTKTYRLNSHILAKLAE